MKASAQLVVEPRGWGEWIVARGKGGRALHMYRLGAHDWLVSEVGRDNEGRGDSLQRSLTALASDAWPVAAASTILELLEA